MSRILFWLVVVFAVLFVLRLVNGKRTQPPSARSSGQPKVESMVRCACCGVYIPRSEATEKGERYYCRDLRCNRPS